MAETPLPWRGIYPPMATPLTDRDTVDAAGLERLVNHILAGGVNGLFILGSTGEATSLSYRLRREVIQRVCAQAAPRTAILVGVTDTAFVETVNLAVYAKEQGAAAVVLAPPYYFPEGQPELIEYLEHLTPELPLPLFLYNIPGLSKVQFEPDTVRQAAALPGVVGMKDSSRNMLYFHQVKAALADRPHFALMQGIEELLGESLLLGAHGGVPGGGNLFPRLYVDLYQAATAGQLARTRELHEKIIAVSNRMYYVGRHGSSYFKGVKCALSCLGICRDTMAEPFHHFNAPERARIEQGLRELKAIGVY